MFARKGRPFPEGKGDKNGRGRSQSSRWPRDGWSAQDTPPALGLSEKNDESDRIDALYGFERPDRTSSHFEERVGWLINMRTVVVEEDDSGNQMAGVTTTSPRDARNNSCSDQRSCHLIILRLTTL